MSSHRAYVHSKSSPRVRPPPRSEFRPPFKVQTAEAERRGSSSPASTPLRSSAQRGMTTKRMAPEVGSSERRTPTKVKRTAFKDGDSTRSPLPKHPRSDPLSAGKPKRSHRDEFQHHQYGTIQQQTASGSTGAVAQRQACSEGDIDQSASTSRSLLLANDRSSRTGSSGQKIKRERSLTPCTRPQASSSMLATDETHTVSITSAIYTLKDRIERVESIFSSHNCSNMNLRSSLDEILDSTVKLDDDLAFQDLSEEDCRLLDACSTLLWNRTVFVAMDAGAHPSKDVLSAVATSRAIAFQCLRLTIGEGNVEIVQRLQVVAAKTVLSLIDADCLDVAMETLTLADAAIGQTEKSACKGLSDKECEAKALYLLAKSVVDAQSSSGCEIEHLLEALELLMVCEQAPNSLDEALFRTITCVRRRLEEASVLDREGHFETLTSIQSVLATAETALSKFAQDREGESDVRRINIGLLRCRAQFELATLTSDAAGITTVLTDLLAFGEADAELGNKASLALVRAQIATGLSESSPHFKSIWMDLAGIKEWHTEELEHLVDVLLSTVERSTKAQWEIFSEAVKKVSTTLLENQRKLPSLNSIIARIWLPLLRKVPAQSIETMRDAFDTLEQAGFQLQKKHALEWHLVLEEILNGLPESSTADQNAIIDLACHLLFFTLPENIAVFRRRAARQFIAANKYEEALAQLASCPRQDDAITIFHYMWLFVESGDQVRALQVLTALQDRNQLSHEWLLWTLDISQRRDMRKVTEKCLQILVSADDGGTLAVNMLDQIRTAVQLCISRAVGARSWASKDFEDITAVLSKALEMELPSEDHEREHACLARNFDWLIKRLYSLSVDPTVDVSSDDRVLIAQTVLELVAKRCSLVSDSDAEVHRVRLWCATGILNYYDSDDFDDRTAAKQKVLQMSATCLQYLEAAKRVSDQTITFNSVDSAIWLLRIEALVALQEWQEMDRAINSDIGQLSLSGMSAIIEVVLSSREIPLETRCSSVVILVVAVGKQTQDTNIVSTENVLLFVRTLLEQILDELKRSVSARQEHVASKLFMSGVKPLLESRHRPVPPWDRTELQCCSSLVWKWMYDAARRRKPALAGQLFDFFVVLATIGGSSASQIEVKKSEWNAIMVGMEQARTAAQ